MQSSDFFICYIQGEIIIWVNTKAEEAKTRTYNINLSISMLIVHTSLILAAVFKVLFHENQVQVYLDTSLEL